ncbi:phosphatase PAP2 family protein [Prosthecobacter sp.]|uniref:phosphatase PAP2 family protein n=1 Tax=Prosthecobacter sp. TaxID=1965333 RepID=UPI001DE89CC3|nr:phosphatase PAP2 family protein [Prosthecobacter sp.]MCB1275443.1 phosphatase PAP2 family protein [Prosthecobacter sp.]
MNAWDLSLLHQINTVWSHPVLDWLMPALSAIEAWLPLIIAAVLITAWRGSKRTRVMLLCLGVAIGLGDGVISNTLKKTIGRVRPRDAMEGVIVRDLGIASPAFIRLFETPVVKPCEPNGDTRGKSLPSSHTVNLFAAATVIASFYRRAGMLMYLLAAAVAYSRVYCGAHWPSDIPPSVALGVLVGLGVVSLSNRMSRRQPSAHGTEEKKE